MPAAPPSAGEQKVLGHQLADQAGAPGSQRCARSEFPPACAAASQQQAGNIRAGNEQEQRGRTNERYQCGSNAAREALHQRQHLYSDIPVRIRKGIG